MISWFVSHWHPTCFGNVDEGKNRLVFDVFTYYLYFNTKLTGEVGILSELDAVISPNQQRALMIVGGGKLEVARAAIYPVTFVCFFPLLFL